MLRDRLAARTKQQRTTLAGAITRALDDSDERACWDQVRVGHARLSAAEREHGAADPTRTDDLVNPADDALGEDEW